MIDDISQVLNSFTKLGQLALCLDDDRIRVSSRSKCVTCQINKIFLVNYDYIQCSDLTRETQEMINMQECFCLPLDNCFNVSDNSILDQRTRHPQIQKQRKQLSLWSRQLRCLEEQEELNKVRSDILNLNLEGDLWESDNFWWIHGSVQCIKGSGSRRWLISLSVIV